MSYFVGYNSVNNKKNSPLLPSQYSFDNSRKPSVHCIKYIDVA